MSTRIMESDRNRPPDLQNKPSDEIRSREQTGRAAELREMARSGTPPAGIAEAVFEAIREERFYILPHTEANCLDKGSHGRHTEGTESYPPFGCGDVERGQQGMP